MPAGFQAADARRSSTAMKAPPMPSGRGETVLTLPTLIAFAGSMRRSAAPTSARRAPLDMWVVNLLKGQYITGVRRQQGPRRGPRPGLFALTWTRNA